MKRRSVLMAGALLLSAMLWVLPSAGLCAELTLKLGHVAPPGPTTHDVSAKKFAERVLANTNGKVEIKVFGNSQFGNLFEHWSSIKAGAIDAFVQDYGAAYMVEPDPKNFNITFFPYLFESQEHLQKFCKSELFTTLMERAEKAGNIKWVGYVGDRTPRGFTTTNKRVTTPDEIKGLKLRVPEVPPFVAAYKAWGANPTPVTASELYSSLKSGLVVGMDQDLTMTYAAKYFEIQKYFTAINYMRSGMGCWVNAQKWEALSPEWKAAFLKSAQETAAFVNDFTAQQMREAEEGVKKAGMEIIQPDLKPWAELAEKEFIKSDGVLWEKGLYAKVKALK
jgi:tripartite ATP-independent transporter DctP family solute receptor